MSNAPRFNRRRLLAAGGGLAAAVGIGAGFGMAGLANADAAVPASGKFDLSAPSDRLFWKKPLQDTTVLQTFSFDNSRAHLYTMQVSNGSDSNGAGHITMTHLDNTGKKLGHMYLKGFGHGIAFGVQPTDNGVTMWTEADAQPVGDSARARVLCRFPWNNGATISKADVELYEPIPDMESASCTLDLEHNTIAVRYSKPDLNEMRVSLYDFDEFAAKKFDNPLADISTRPAHPAGVTPQGYQHYGQHLYLYQGNAYHHPDGDKYCSVEHPDGELDGNTKVSRINFNDETDHETLLTKAGYSLSFREPEGMGLVHVDAKPRLAMGFASGCSGGRLASIYYKRNPAS